MGLRPSGRNEDDSFNNAPASPKSPRGSEVPSCRCESSSSPTLPPASSSPPLPRRQAWTARGQLLLDFHHAISRAINSPEMAQRCGQIAEDASRVEGEGSTTRRRPGIAAAAEYRVKRDPSTAEEYGAEAALIVENKSRRDAAVRNKSVALGVLSFATLRGGRAFGSWARRMIVDRASVAHGGVYRFDKVPSQSIEPSVESAAIVPPTSSLCKFLRIANDATISSTIALLSGTFLFMPRPSAYIEDMSKLPLVEGKSAYAEMVCPPLMREYRRVMEQYGGRWPVMRRENAAGLDGTARVPQFTQEDVSLNVIRTFVENCSKRSKYERALLEERDALGNFDNESASPVVSRFMDRIAPSESTVEKVQSLAGSSSKDAIKNKLGTISIPNPGVPENIAVDIDLEIFSLAEDEDEVNKG